MKQILNIGKPEDWQDFWSRTKTDSVLSSAFIISFWMEKNHPSIQQKKTVCWHPSQKENILCRLFKKRI